MFGFEFFDSGCFGGRKILQEFFLTFVFCGYSKQFEVFGSAHVNVGQPCSSSNKVQPKLFSGCVNI